MKKALLIINPNAHGSGNNLAPLPDILNVFSAADFRTEVYMTQHRGDATAKIPELAKGVDVVVSCGGDGTMNEVVTGLMHMKPFDRPPLGLIPFGTTNDLAKSHNIVGTPIEAARIITENSAKNVDLGVINGNNYFEYVTGFGMFTASSYRVSPQAKSIMGYTAYLLSGAVELINLTATPVKITTDDECWEDEIMLALITNASQVAGFKDVIAYNIDTNDGKFEILLVRKPNDLLEMNEMARGLLGVKDNKLVRRIKASHVSFDFLFPTDWVKDGEYAGTYKSATVKNIHSAIQIIEGPEIQKITWSEQITNLWSDLGQNPSPLTF